MTNDKVFGVLLTDEAWDEVGAALDAYTTKGPLGRYIYCQRVETAGNYFEMRVTTTNRDGSTFEADVLIPHNYVKLCIGAADKRQIGFVQSED